MMGTTECSLCHPLGARSTTRQTASRTSSTRTLPFSSFGSSSGLSTPFCRQTDCSSSRPRGWHLDETRVIVDGEPLSGSMFDFGLYFFHNAFEAVKRGFGPYFYLPKMEHYLEVR